MHTAFQLLFKPQRFRFLQRKNIHCKDKGKFFFYCCQNARGAHIISGPGNESKIPSKFVTGRDIKEVLGGTRF
jgi:hypothetical protein